VTGRNRLFDTEPFENAGRGGPAASPDPTGGEGIDRTPTGHEAHSGRIVRVLPDVSGLDKVFDYFCPPDLEDRVAIGSMVRVELHGRRVGGWVVGLDTEPPPGVSLQPIAKFSSVGPSADTVELARWAAHRWSGRLARVLKAASPHRMVPVPPEPVGSHRRTGPAPAFEAARSELGAAVLDHPGVTALQLAPSDDQRWLAAEAADRGDCLVVVPEIRRARNLVRWLRRHGYRAHLAADDWAGGLTGGVVVGSRSAVWAPVADLRTVVVLDEHDESLQEERSPTWHARDVAVERARRAGARCLIAGPCLSLAGRVVADRVVEVDRRAVRHGWPVVEVVDRRSEEPGRAGLFSPRLVQLLRASPSAVLVLNRKGRARLLACASCGELVRTEDGQHLMVEDDGVLTAPATGESRPLICAVCTGTTLKRLRLGVVRAAEELARLVEHTVIEVTGDRVDDPVAVGPGVIVLGTEAALFRHHYRSRQPANTSAAGWPDRGESGLPSTPFPTVAGLTPMVAFLDMDQELMAPRYRAAEQAMVLLARAARLVGGRGDGNRVVVQTRNPDHRTLRAAVSADPSELVTVESEQRRVLGLPPFTALAEISGRDAATLTHRLEQLERPGLVVLGPRPDGRYLVRAPGWGELADALAEVDRHDIRTRVAVDPPRA
jgi:primosomal protein N' (replication factor Y)